MKARTSINKPEIDFQDVQFCKSCQKSLGFVICATRLIGSMNTWIKSEPISEQSVHQAYSQMLRLLNIANRSLENISGCEVHKKVGDKVSDLSSTLPAKQRW